MVGTAWKARPLWQHWENSSGTCKATMAAEKNAVRRHLAEAVEVLPFLVEDCLGGIAEPAAPSGVLWVYLVQWRGRGVGVAGQPFQVVLVAMDPPQQDPKQLVFGPCGKGPATYTEPGWLLVGAAGPFAPSGWASGSPSWWRLWPQHVAWGCLGLWYALLAAGCFWLWHTLLLGLWPWACQVLVGGFECWWRGLADSGPLLDWATHHCICGVWCWIWCRCCGAGAACSGRQGWWPCCGCCCLCWHGCLACGCARWHACCHGLCWC